MLDGLETIVMTTLVASINESLHRFLQAAIFNACRDEEYDRGKRKKVRQPKLTPGGPNPFQILANKKSQLKKARIERFDSGNHPLRI